LADKNIFFEMVAPSNKNKNGLVRGWLEAKDGVSHQKKNVLEWDWFHNIFLNAHSSNARV
jgi:hypothetical protein